MGRVLKVIVAVVAAVVVFFLIADVATQSWVALIGDLVIVVVLAVIGAAVWTWRTRRAG